jgi:hypothetical protein
MKKRSKVLLSAGLRRIIGRHSQLARPPDGLPTGACRARRAPDQLKRNLVAGRQRGSYGFLAKPAPELSEW